MTILAKDVSKCIEYKFKGARNPVYFKTKKVMKKFIKETDGKWHSFARTMFEIQNNKDLDMHEMYMETLPNPFDGIVTEFRHIHAFRWRAKNERIVDGEKVYSYGLERDFYDMRPGFIRHSSVKDILKENMKLVRLMMNGPDAKVLRSNISGEVLEKRKSVINPKARVNIWDLHHTDVRGGASFHKNGDNPSQSLNSLMFLDNHKAIKEIMGCVAVSRSEHKIIHGQTPHSSLLNYEKEMWPWHLRKKENYDYVVCSLNNSDSWTLSYEKMIEELTGWHKENKTDKLYLDEAKS